jgi:hypothetical protein
MNAKIGTKMQEILVLKYCMAISALSWKWKRTFDIVSREISVAAINVSARISFGVGYPMACNRKQTKK